MKLAKSLLLGSAAGIVAVAGASAADLGVKKPSAVEYVKTCPTYGAGFFVVPGTQSCLKLIGRVRADYTFNNDLTRASAKNTFRVRGYLGFDHRTATEYGLLRTYVRMFLGRDNAANLNNTSSAATLEYAYIQFGGLTVGRVLPYFDAASAFYSSSVLWGGSGIGGFSDIAYINTFAYTHSFGGGFSASVSLDSAAERQIAIAGGAYGGQAMPEITGKLAYDASWGSVALSGAIHQIRTATSVGGVIPGTRYGYAGALFASVNLPGLPAGSHVWANIAYADGASSYTGWASGNTAVGHTSFAASDATIVGTSLRTTRSWGLSGGVKAYVNPNVWVGLNALYGVHDAAGSNNTVRSALIGGTVGWTPVAGFLIAGEVNYAKLMGRTVAAGGVLAQTGGTKRDAWTGRLRFQRDF